jgi:Ni/Co efflux regulator RcnB
MRQINKTAITAIMVLTTIAILNANPAIADKPSKTGDGKHEKHQQNGPQGKQEKHQKYKQQDNYHKQNKQQGNYQKQSHQDKNKADFNGGGYFNDEHRTVINNYFANEYRTGRCPPGLAKKHNGCMPPGQAKKWAIGRPLPRDVVFYDLPQSVMANIGPPPAGYRLVRVASDILMINTGTGMVMDAINDLGR